MTLSGELFMRDDPQVLSRRLARFVRDTPAKELADTIGCTIRTAENIRRGHWPIARHWLAIVRTFGRDVLDAVFLPEIDETLARLTAEEAQLDRQLAAVRARLREAEGRSAGVQGVHQTTPPEPE